jgi:hypothetical protein
VSLVLFLKFASKTHLKRSVVKLFNLNQHNYKESTVKLLDAYTHVTYGDMQRAFADGNWLDLGGAIYSVIADNLLSYYKKRSLSI